MSNVITASRVLFGLWLVILGAHQFTPVLPISVSGSGDSALLIAAFRDTGLLGMVAVALVSIGALVIANRLTVLALGAALPVLVCGLYWATLLEHSAPLGLLGMVSIAINLRLLFAYRSYFDQLFEKNALGADETGGEPNPFLFWAEKVSRYVWGVWFVWSATFHFYSSPLYGTEPLAIQLMVALVQTNLYELVKGTELLGGIAVLARRWAPLGLLVNVPITLVVMHWDLVLQGQNGLLGLLIVVLTFGFSAIIMWSYRAYYRPLLTWRPVPVGQDAA